MSDIVKRLQRHPKRLQRHPSNDHARGCKDCRGSGNGWVAKTNEGDWIDVPCPTCNGTGKVDLSRRLEDE